MHELPETYEKLATLNVVSIPVKSLRPLKRILKFKLKVSSLFMANFNSKHVILTVYK